MKKLLIAALLSTMAVSCPVMAYENIVIGDSGETVREIQKVLIDEEFLNGEADGNFGKGTEEAVKKYQEEYELDVTGIVGQGTLSYMMNLQVSEVDDWVASITGTSVAPKTDSEEGPTAGLSTEFKKSVDDMEEFFNSYAEFMESFSDDAGIEELLKYAELVGKYADAQKELDDIGSKATTPEESDYYDKAMLRISAKLLEVASKM